VGLTPKQRASGNISKMGGITKRGDRYLRKQLVHGARSVVSRAAKRQTLYHYGPRSFASPNRLTKWRLAVAHRLARLIWILLTRQERYRAASTSQEVSA
jgi:transposase